MTIDISDEAGAFYVGQDIGHYELGVNHGLIKPRKLRIYGDTYTKEYPIAKEYPADELY